MQEQTNETEFSNFIRDQKKKNIYQIKLFTRFKELYALFKDTLKAFNNFNNKQKASEVKKESDSDFNISADSFDGAEIFDKIGVYILNILGEEYGKERVGLYKNTG